MRKLKVLCEYTPSGPHYVRTGWGRVFQAMGHEFRFWERKAAPAFEAFDFKPDIYLGTTYDLDRATIKCVARQPAMKVGLFASGWGPKVDALPESDFPLVRIQAEEIERVAQLKEMTGKPDFVFIHCADKNVADILGGWSSIGVKPIGVLNAADAFVLSGGKFRKELSADWTFCGSRWPYKARNLDPFLLPLCQVESGLKGRIYGASGWQMVPQWVGTVTEEDKRDAFASSLVCPNISEPHSTDPRYGCDIVERVFQVPYAGGCLVSDYVEEIGDVFGDTVPMARTPVDFLCLVKFYAHPDNKSEREKVVEKTRDVVVRGHLYHDRVARFFFHFGMLDETERCLDMKEEMLCGIG